MSDQRPIHVSVDITPSGTQVWVNGIDISTHLCRFSVDARPGALGAVWLDLVGVEVDIQAEVPRDYVQAVTLEQDHARQVARQTTDVDRGLKPHMPHALLAVSLGQVKR